MMYQERQRTAEIRGEKKKQIEMVKRMLAENLSLDLIARISGLSRSEVEDIRDKMAS